MLTDTSSAFYYRSPYPTCEGDGSRWWRAQLKIVSVINYKGGVGKTTLTANLGAELARRGGRVLLIDLDPQCSLTFSD
jgi:Mrp family chromosome partitioning ATPase